LGCQGGRKRVCCANKDRREAVFSKLRAGAKACRVEERQAAFAVREGGLKGFEGIKP
tara:strand:- start:314 stop:484 length:171 start_codon:yes stop_codon:yes gene_type:complete